jgi:hypothetical protein
MNKQHIETIDKLRRAIQAIKNGKRIKKRVSVHMNMYGENMDQYLFQGKLYSTPDELEEELKNWENLDGKRDIIFIMPDDED